MTDFSSAKIRRPFLLWLKVEAARQEIPIYALIERLAAKATETAGRDRKWSQSRG